MSIVSENPCFVGRAACGMKCAREYAVAYVKQHKKMPSYTYISEHIPGFSTYSAQHRDNMWCAACGAARRTLETLIQCPNNLRSDVAENAPFFYKMGYELTTHFDTGNARWVLLASIIYGRKNTLAHEDVFAGRYEASTIESLYRKLASSVRASANDSVAA